MQLTEICDWIAAHLREEREDLSWLESFAYLQHYGMPSRIVDITGDLGLAFAFAAHGNSSVGRLAVVPYLSGQTAQVTELFAHPWAERAQRQAAYGVIMDPHEVNDLKADAVRTRLNIKWFEFKILQSEKTATEEKFRELLLEPNDPSAGFVRYYITRYVEAHGKLSPALTEWLLKNVVIAPYCFWVKAHEEKEAVVFFRGSEAIKDFDKSVETEWSRRYWSSAYKDDRSEARVKNCALSPAGSTWCDPRTHHPYGPPSISSDKEVMHQ